jgi:eukaryotic-like serine/threonine-protein kinase
MIEMRWTEKNQKGAGLSGRRNSPRICTDATDRRRFISVPIRRLREYPWLIPLLPIAICLLIFCTANSQSPDSWPQFRGNYNLTGIAQSQPPAELKQLWTYDAGDVIESSAAIADGTVYVGTGKGELIAVDLSSGKLKWRYSTKEPIGESSPAVGGGLVFVGDLSGVFHAVNASDGKGIWTYKTGSEIKSSPVIVGDRVLIGSYDGNLYCFNARDGKTLWSFKTENFVHGTPAVVDGVAYIAGCDELFRGIRISDGKEVMKIPAGGYTGASPAMVGQSAYFGNFNNEVIRLNLRARRQVWRYSHPKRQFPFYSSPAVVDGKVVLGGRDKMVHCLNAATGKAIWTFTTRARVESSPAVSGGRVYIGSNDGRFYVLDLAKGTKLWEFTIGSPVSASPAIANGKIVIGGQDGKLYCFG